MVGGVHCAGQILDRPLLVEMMMGTQLVRAGRRSPRIPDGFDPMEWSRGARLREQRARAAGPQRRPTPPHDAEPT